MTVPRKPRRKLKYTIVIKDDGISVCEIRFGNNDMANFIGVKLAEFINFARAVNTDEMHYPGYSDGWAGSGYENNTTENGDSLF